MDKIEKLKPFEEGMTAQYEYNKINEIIDVLNSQLFEPRILNYPLSQKQPEVEPEKQEEWKERLELGWDYEDRSLVLTIDDKYVEDAPTLINFISQLLSDREYAIIKEIREEYWERDDFGQYIEDRLSKLLKEEE